MGTLTAHSLKPVQKGPVCLVAHFVQSSLRPQRADPCLPASEPGPRGAVTTFSKRGARASQCDLLVDADSRVGNQ